MKRKSRRGFALVLAFVMTGAACMMPDIKVSAASAAGTVNTQVKNLEAVNKTTESITLRTQENYEYAIETVTNDVKAWKWADASQYDKTNKTVTFTGLKAETSYQFACRQAGSTEVLEQLSVQTAAAKVDETGQNVDTTVQDPPAQTSTVQAPPEQNTGEKEPEVTDVVTSPLDDSTNVTNADKTPAVNQADDNKTPSGTDDQQTTEVQKVQYSQKTVDDQKTVDTQKTEDGQKTPDNQQTPQLLKPEAPVVAEVTDTKITLALPEKADPKFKYEFSMDGKTFQDAPVFDKLDPEKEYKFCMRAKAGRYDGTDYPDASENSDFTAPVSTKKSAPDQPKYQPVVAERTDTSISLKASKDEQNPGALEYGKLGASAADTEWKADGIFDQLTPGTEYQFVVRYGVDPDKQMQGEAGDVLKVTTLEQAAQAPAAPGLEKRSETSITLKAVDGQQYAVLGADGSTSWQDSPQFDGLKANTAYQFVTRMKYDPEKAMESMVSEAAGFKTIISFEGSKITGIKAGGSYEEGTKLTAVAVGTGMDNASPAAGDTRWVPKSWSWDGKTWKSWEKAPYSIMATYDKPGGYNLRVAYELQEYTQNGWQKAEGTNTTNVKFTITEKKVFFKIQAEAGANGKITPSGTVEVQKGKDYEFTFTPNKRYRTAKVTVDGKSVTFKNNKYTFTNVQEAHKIVVTFEKDKNTPKTGDMANPALFAGLLLLSGMLIIALAYRRRRR